MVVICSKTGCNRDLRDDWIDMTNHKFGSRELGYQSYDHMVEVHTEFGKELCLKHWDEARFALEKFISGQEAFQSSLKSCPKCGHRNAYNFNFCCNCGVRLPCGWCGTDLKPEDDLRVTPCCKVSH